MRTHRAHIYVMITFYKNIYVIRTQNEKKTVAHTRVPRYSTYETVTFLAEYCTVSL
jgi:hypothetical protein